MGHIRSLEEDLGAVGLDRDFEPRFQWIREKAKAIAQIKEAAAGAKTIYLASDDDREGEAISYSVAQLLNLNPATTPRAVFREITESAVRAAVAAPRRLDMNRVHAQQARAVLDMMVGFTISPLLWKYVGPALSAGRCQTAALRLLVDQEKLIGQHTVSTAWKIRGTWAGGSPFVASMTEELEDQESATNYLENIHADTPGKITSAVTKPTTEYPPKPLITSTLQQEASASMSLQPKRTMQIAQRLYEAGHITYMRTDSPVLSEEAAAAAAAWVRTTFGEEYTGSAKKSKSQATQAKATAGAQEAHEAIRPTHVERAELPQGEDWNAVDRKLYKLIWSRAVQSVMTPAKGEQRTVEFVATGDPMEFIWRAVWKRQLFLGWRKIGAAATNFDETEAEQLNESWAAAEKLVEGAALNWLTLEAWPEDSRPPARYTEATLVRELEKRGIGRPSTFASLVGTVLDKGYAEKRDTPARDVAVTHLHVERPGQWPPTILEEMKKVGAEKQKLAPTPLGLSVLEFCIKEFDGLFNYDFTKSMETRLDGIADGTEAWKELCRDTWASYQANYIALKEGNGAVAPAAARQRMFAEGIKAVQSKKGPILLKEDAANKDNTVFYGWPAGKSFQDITEADVAAFMATKVQPAAVGQHNGKAILKKSGPYGTYAECDGVKVPWKDDDTMETLVAKFEAKTKSALHTLGPFEFRTGPYGVFMFKKDLVGPARKFVNVPSGVDPKILTQEAAIKIYQTGLQQKAKGQAYKKKNGQ
jgi:DNA topoisomerase-1